MTFRPTLSITAALVLSAPAMPAAGQTSQLYGQAALSPAATREILIDPNTRHVNVIPGETVNFDVGGQRFAWTFSGRPQRAFDLRDIAPAGALDRPVTVYVAADPRDLG